MHEQTQTLPRFGERPALQLAASSDPLAGPLNENWLVSIGNTDNRLTQAAWSLFISETVGIIDSFRVSWHGRWYSGPTDPWQNANFCFQLPDLPTLGAYMAHTHDLESQLALTAARFAQDTIAVTRGPVKFIPATRGVHPILHDVPTQVLGLSGETRS